MRRLLLSVVLVAFAIHECSAQLNHVGWGGGPMQFNNYNATTNGFAGYLGIGFDVDRDLIQTIGGQLIIAGDSRISRGGEDKGAGFVGLVAFAETKGFVRFGVFAGGGLLQNYERVDDLINTTIDPRPRPVLTKQTFQPYGGVKVGIGPVEVQYAPVSNMITIGFRLYNGN